MTRKQRRRQIAVTYQGLLSDLFYEGQGKITEGVLALSKSGVGTPDGKVQP